MLLSGLGLLSPVLVAIQIGSEAIFSLQPSVYLRLASQNAEFIFTQQYEQSLISKISSSFFQSACILAGLYIAGFGRLTKIKWHVVLIAVLPGLLLTLVTTQRSPLIISLVWLFSGFIAATIILGRERRLFDIRYLVSILFAVFGVAVAVVLIQSVRGGELSSVALSESLQHLRPWAAGYIAAFSNWVSGYWSEAPLHGQTLMRGVLNSLGVGDGVGISTRMAAVQIGNQQTSNAMTVARHFVMDFGMAGALVGAMVWGMLSAILYGWTRSGSRLAMVLLSANLSAIVWSPNSWFLGYGSRILAVFVAIAALYFTEVVRRRRLLYRHRSMGALDSGYRTATRR